MVLRLDLEAAVHEQPAQRREREVPEMARQIQMEPGGARPARLQARQIRHRHHQPTPRPQDPVRLQQGALRIVQVFEHVPDHDLVEVRRRVASIGQARRDPDLGARIGAARGLERDLDAVHLEAAVGQRAEDHPAAAAQIEHARARAQIPREEGDVSLAYPAHEALDQALELATRLTVVFAGVEGSHLFEIGHRMQTAESAPGADEHTRRQILDREGGAGLLRTADETRSHVLRRLRSHVEGFDVTLVQGFAAQGGLSRVRGIVRGGFRKVKGMPRRAA